MDWAQLYATLSQQLQAGASLPFWQDFFVNFYRSFIHDDSWKLYLKGVLTTLQVTVTAATCPDTLPAKVMFSLVRKAMGADAPAEPEAPSRTL